MLKEGGKVVVGLSVVVGCGRDQRFGKTSYGTGQG